ncbi:MAG: hypothetical protein JNK85_09780 [Verrucomicrobiales bacterium]|nr:hypothetical protein [Verrucomicrobiales bacterium]
MPTPPVSTTLTLAAAALLTVPTAFAADDSPWSFSSTLYVLAAGMTGEVGAGPIDADLDLDFGDIWNNLEFGAMGSMRVGYDRWSLNADVIYMGLGANKDGFNADLDQWVVEPTIAYRFCKNFEVLAGVRYNNLSGEIHGPGYLPTPRFHTGTQDWWDPIIGANLHFPFAKKFSFDFRGDVGGFGVGSDLTWQAFPFLTWQISHSFSTHLGYRLVLTDYETGSGRDRFRYDMLSHGPQVGATFRF